MKAAALARIMRPGNAAISAVAALVGAYLAGGAWGGAVIGAAIASFAFAAAGNVRNDMGDVVIDRRAHPDRPLVTGAVTMAEAILLSVGLYLVALAMGNLVGWRGFVLVLAAIPLMEGYERGWKAHGFAGNLVIGILTGAPFVLGGLAGGHVGPAVWTVAGLAALATVGREVLKDIEDMDADAATRRTLPMRVGVRAAWAVAASFLVGAVALSPLPFLLETVLGWPYLATVSVADACFLAATVEGRRRPARGQRLAKIGMVIALVALVGGRAYVGGGVF